MTFPEIRSVFFSMSGLFPYGVILCICLYVLLITFQMELRYNKWLDGIQVKYFFCQEYFIRVFASYYNTSGGTYCWVISQLGMLNLVTCLKKWLPNLSIIKINFFLCNYRIICVVLGLTVCKIFCPHQFFPPFSMHW